VCVNQGIKCVYQICSARYHRALVLPVTLARDHAKLLGADDKETLNAATRAQTDTLGEGEEEEEEGGEGDRGKGEVDVIQSSHTIVYKAHTSRLV
jgi:hypothetical protein